MSVRQLSSMTWEEVRDLDRERTVVILPIGAIEAHGPHLPLGTDVIISEAMARAGGEQLGTHGIDTVILPTIPYTPAGFASSFAGTISIDSSTFQTYLHEVSQSLHFQGFRTLALANSHLDPTHLAALHTFANDAEVELTIVFPNLARRGIADQLTEEFRSGACHAGQFETSIVQAERADLVRDDIRQQLDPNPVSLSDAIRDGATRFEDIGGDRAYFGFPAQATIDEGQTTIATLGGILADAVMEVLDAT
jgi:creatinine amidohydrolase